MKILHILSQLPDHTGSGKYLQAVIKGAAGKGHDNFLIAGIQGDFTLDPLIIPPENTLFVRFNTKDLDFPIPGMSDVMPYASTVFSTFTSDQITRYTNAFKKAILSVQARFQPDLIHTHHLWIISKITRTLLPDLPMVTTCHGTCLRQLSLCPDLGNNVQRSCRNINRIMSLSHFQKKEIQRIHSIDSPFQKDMGLLEDRLANTIRNVMEKVLKNRQPDMEAALKITGEYTWTKVYSRIESAYKKALSEACM